MRISKQSLYKQVGYELKPEVQLPSGFPSVFPARVMLWLMVSDDRHNQGLVVQEKQIKARLPTKAT